MIYQYEMGSFLESFDLGWTGVAAGFFFLKNNSIRVAALPQALFFSKNYFFPRKSWYAQVSDVKY